MSKRHFEAIAAILSEQLKAAKTSEAREALRLTIYALCDEFASENPGFLRGRFCRACGI